MPRGVDRYDEAQLQGRLWTPRVLGAGLVGWWDANARHTISIGTGISAWNSLVGGWSLTQGTGSAQPTYVVNEYGKPCARFAVGSSQYLAGTFDLTSTTIGVFACGKMNSGTQGFGGIVNAARTGQRDYDGTDSWAMISRRSTNAEIIGTRGVDSDIVGMAVAVTNVMSSIYDSPNSNLSLGVNGSLSTKNNAAYANQRILNLLNFGGRIAAGGTYAGPYLDGDISEVVIVNFAPTQAQRYAIEGYLAWNNFGSNARNPLLASHPFKNRPPLIGD